MAKQHVEVLTGLGLDKELIDRLEGITEDKLGEFKADEYTTAVRNNIKTILSNDPDFLGSIPEDKIPQSIKKAIEKGQYARFQNELEEVAVKQLGLDPEALTAEDKKSIKGFTKKVADMYLAKNNNTEGLKDLNDKYSKALQDLDKVKTESEAEMTKKLEELNGKNTSKFIKTLAKSELAQLEGINLKVNSKFVSDPVLSELSNKYAVVLDADDNLTLKQKENPALDVLDSTGKKVTFSQAMKEAVVSLGLGEVSKGDEGNGGGKKRININGDEGGNGGNGGDDVKVPAYIREKMNFSSEE